jgi:hypothetical protein
VTIRYDVTIKVQFSLNLPNEPKRTFIRKPALISIFSGENGISRRIILTRLSHKNKMIRSFNLYLLRACIYDC